jgi:hypothetical protein
MYVPSKLFQPSLKFVGKLRIYRIEELLSGVLLGLAPAFITNIRLGREALRWYIHSISLG